MHTMYCVLWTAYCKDSYRSARLKGERPLPIIQVHRLHKRIILGIVVGHQNHPSQTSRTDTTWKQRATRNVILLGLSGNKSGHVDTPIWGKPEKGNNTPLSLICSSCNRQRANAQSVLLNAGSISSGWDCACRIEHGSAGVCCWFPCQAFQRELMPKHILSSASET